MVLRFKRSLDSRNNIIEKQKARPVIFDTDWCSDVDDVVAARVLAFGERIGRFDLIACIVSVYLPSLVPSLDAFMAGEGRAGLVIGVNKNGASYDTLAPNPFQPNMLYKRHDYASSASAEDSTDVYRRAFANTNEKIDVIITGSCTAFWRFLTSTADAISPLTGMELAIQKLNQVWIMGGQFPSGTEWNFSHNTDYKTASRYVCLNCPAPITFLGYETNILGGSDRVLTGSTLGTVLGTTNDMLAKALADYGAGTTGRESWDPMTMLLALRNDLSKAGYIAYNGSVNVNLTTGLSTFTYNPTAKDRYVVKIQTNDWYKREIDTILERDSWGDRKLGTKQIAKLPQTTSFVDSANLLTAFDANDYSTSADGDIVAHIEDKTGNKNHLRNSNGTTCPVFKPNQAGINGTYNSFYFSGTKYLFSDLTEMTSTMTVHIKCKWDTLPTSYQILMCQDFPNLHLWHLKGVAGSNIMGARFKSGVGIENTTTGTNLIANKWHVISYSMNSTESKVYLDGVLLSTKTYTDAFLGFQKLLMGAHSFSSTMSEYLVGHINSGRIYRGVQDQTTITNVVNPMNA